MDIATGGGINVIITRQVVVYAPAERAEKLLLSLHYPYLLCGCQWCRRLEEWSNTAARLAGWKSDPACGVILYLRDGPYRLPRRTTPLAPFWGLSIKMYTKHHHELRHARKAWHSTVGPTNRCRFGDRFLNACPKKSFWVRMLNFRTLHPGWPFFQTPHRRRGVACTIVKTLAKEFLLAVSWQLEIYSDSLLWMLAKIRVF